MANERLRFELEGVEITPPEEWESMTYSATFENGSVEGNISTSTMTFFLDAAKSLHQHRVNGLSGGTGIFEGPCAKVFDQDATTTIPMFDGFVDMANDEYKERDFKGPNFTDPTEVVASLKRLNSLNELDERAKHNTMGYLESIGVFSDSDYVDVKWVIEQRFDPVGLVLTFSVTYMFIKEVGEAIERVKKLAADLSAHVAGGATGPIAAGIWLGVVILINILYIATMLANVINLMEKTINNLISPIRIHKGIRLRTLIENSLNHLGFQLDCDIVELDTFVYLPSRPNGTGTLVDKILNLVKVNNKGIPNGAADFGYFVSDALELVLRLFNGKSVIQGNTVFIRTESSEFWRRNANYTLPDLLLDEVEFNTDELKANRLHRFETDISDEFTISDFDGTNVEYITTPLTVNDQRKNGIRGLDDKSIPMALGNVKGELGAIENAVLAVAQFAEDAVNIFGSNKDFTSKIKNRVKILKMSGDTFNVAKLLYMPNNDGLIPLNHRDFLSASVLADKYYSKRILRGERLQPPKVSIPEHTNCTVQASRFQRIITKFVFYN